MTKQGKVRPRRKAGDTPVPVSGLSIHDRVFLGIDEHGASVDLVLPDTTILVAGAMGRGKSSFINNIVAHAALCTDVDLILIDGKRVEMNKWREIADVVVGRDMKRANHVLSVLVSEMNRCYEWLEQRRRRGIGPGDPFRYKLLIIDEISVFLELIGDPAEQEKFLSMLLDLTSQGRAAGIMVVAATQRPSADIIPTKLRDIMSYRVAFKCTTPASSDIILGNGWAKDGYSATDIDPLASGTGLILEELGIPRRFKSAYLDDDDIDYIVDRARWIRGVKTQPQQPEMEDVA